MGERQRRPCAGDYNGDGKTDLAVFRPSNGTWYIWEASVGTTTGFQWGNGLDVPVPGDYDGDGKTAIAVLRPSNGTWDIVYSSTGTAAGFQWGNGYDIPVPGDHDSRRDRLRPAEAWERPGNIGHCLRTAIRDEGVESERLDHVLAPYWLTLWRLAARGHWMGVAGPGELTPTLLEDLRLRIAGFVMRGAAIKNVSSQGCVGRYTIRRGRAVKSEISI